MRTVAQLNPIPEFNVSALPTIVAISGKNGAEEYVQEEISGFAEEAELSAIIIADTEPVADFSGTPVSGQESLIVNFTDLSNRHSFSSYQVYSKADHSEENDCQYPPDNRRKQQNTSLSW